MKAIIDRLLLYGLILWIAWCSLGIALGLWLAVITDEPKLSATLVVSGSVGLWLGVWLPRHPDGKA